LYRSHKEWQIETVIDNKKNKQQKFIKKQRKCYKHGVLLGMSLEVVARIH
jgi:hypothetical protein